jgi:hypothetical protein
MMADDECVPGCPRRIEDTDDGHWRCAECGAQCLCYPSAPVRFVTGESSAETIKPPTHKGEQS